MALVALARFDGLLRPGLDRAKKRKLAGCVIPTPVLVRTDVGCHTPSGKLKSKNEKIAGYGASGRGTVVMNYCDLDNSYLEYVVDDAPGKQGAYTPGTHLEIVSSNVLKSKNKPAYAILFAWPFMKEVISRNKEYLQSGGKFITPLPKVKIVSK